MPDNVARYVGFALEPAYGDDVTDADFHVDVANISLDSPSEANIEYEGGIGRMPAQVIPGVYAPSGGTEFPAACAVLAYILHLVLGDTTTDDANVVNVPSEAMTADAETFKLYTLANQPVIQGSFIFEDALSAQVAHDNGWGKIVEDAASGISGWINYATGEVYMTGLTPTEAYTGAYDYGWYEHTIVPVDGNAMPSFNAFCGKDLFEHKFLGCILNQLDFSVEQELANLTLDIMSQKDLKKTIVPIEDLLLSSGCHGERVRSFANVTAKIGDHGGALSDISADVRALAFSINNNGTTEENVGIGSRFPTDGTAGALDITGTMTLQFKDLGYKEDFWGDASGAVEGDAQLKAIEIKVDGGGVVSGWGDATVTLGRVLLQSVNIQPSGRDKLMQELSFSAKWDCDLAEIITAVVRNYNRLHNPAP